MATTANYTRRKAADRTAGCDKIGMLHQRALDLLERECAKGDNALWLIAANIGIPYHWLIALRNGRIKQPSVNRIEWMVEKLSGRKIRN